MILSSLGDIGVSNAISRGTNIFNPNMDDMTQRKPIEELLHESKDEEDENFNYMSTCVFYGRKIPFVCQLINEMVPINNSV